MGEEVVGDGLPSQRAVQRAVAKARGATVDGPAGLVLGVDTVVEIDGRELGKPVSRSDAGRMLRTLAGRDHAVHTGLCLRRHPRGDREPSEWTASAYATVRCRELADAEIEAYLEGGEWTDKAGGYAIQGGGGAFMELCEGDFDTVVGLPVRELRSMLGRAAGAGEYREGGATGHDHVGESIGN